jgi:hypothetical protein
MIDPDAANVTCTTYLDQNDEDSVVCCISITITEFYLYDENDILIKAAPEDGSPFQQFVDPLHALDLTFDVCDFTKVEVPIDVLCFIPDDFDLFGFFWFEITEITVREMCFFGDVCIDWWMYTYDEIEQDCVPWVPLDFWLTDVLYPQQEQGIQADMPAIFTLKLYRIVNMLPEYVREWNNEYYPPDFTQFWGGEDDPLCIRYADYDIVADTFKLDMYIYGPWDYPNVFGYTATPQKTWTFYDDAAPLDLNGDGVIEFAWGDCVQSPEYDLADNCQIPGK